jgi:hypothetical protein
LRKARKHSAISSERKNAVFQFQDGVRTIDLVVLVAVAACCFRFSLRRVEPLEATVKPEVGVMKQDANELTNRRHFLIGSAAAAGLAFCPETLLFGQGANSASPATAARSPSSTTAAIKPKPDPLKPELVKEFVVSAHFNLEKTKAMLTETPSLLNATWDWGGGDFEMAIGGAGHMGRRDIALYLIGQGGRFDLFVVAMLGQLDVVKPMLTAFPHLAESKGPHGIPLIVHAQKGAQEAAEVAAFLEELKSKSA